MEGRVLKTEWVRVRTSGLWLVSLLMSCGMFGYPTNSGSFYTWRFGSSQSSILLRSDSKSKLGLLCLGYPVRHTHFNIKQKCASRLIFVAQRLEEPLNVPAPSKPLSPDRCSLLLIPQRTPYERESSGVHLHMPPTVCSCHNAP